ncbi:MULTISPECIES: hypothetical protein [Streptacidiphilus]|uniref:Integral membrane protein n=2 Tax=Streptacidiphilus TaxID=228398 RepID=A0ABV6UH95_9ACTN|nr:hypothetical protein [Streptacidiphilus jeojiense]
MGQDNDAAEVSRLRQQVAELSRPHHRLRSAGAAVLLVLAFVLAPLAVVASWTAGIMGDTDRYVATVGPLVDSPAVQSAVAARASQAVTGHLDLQTVLQQAAPQDRPLMAKGLGSLAAPIENAIGGLVQKEALAVVSSSWFHTFWTDANRRIHSTMVKALTGQGGGAVQLTDDSVVIDLGPVVEQVKQRLVDSGLTVAARIPQVHTSYTVLDAQHIGAARTGFRLLQILGNWLAVLVAVLAAAAVWLARRRRRALVTAALAITVGVLLLGLGLVVARALYLDKLPAGVSPDAAADIFDQLVHFLRTAVRSVAVLGAAVALGAWLSGPGRRATQFRSLRTSGIDATRRSAQSAGLRLGPVGRFVHHWKRWLTWTVLAAGGLTLALWSYPTGWVVTGIVLAVLFALTVVEFLDEGAQPGDAAPGDPAA